MQSRIGSLITLAGLAVSLVACGGGKVVVTPPSTPMVATTPAIPASGVVATVPATPPPPTVEANVASVSPGSEYVWVQGYYNWDGARYQWVPGSWVRTPSVNAMWVPAHWQPTTGGYVWVPGSWR